MSDQTATKTQTKPQTPPTIPEDAPEWVRTHTQRTHEPLSVSRYHAIRAAGLATSEMGLYDLLTEAQRMPPGCVVRFQHGQCKKECKPVDVFGVVLAVGQDWKKPGDIVAALCTHPESCDEPAENHPHVPVRECTVVAYGYGITTEVIRAIYGGQGYEAARLLTLASSPLN